MIPGPIFYLVALLQAFLPVTEASQASNLTTHDAEGAPGIWSAWGADIYNNRVKCIYPFHRLQTNC